MDERIRVAEVLGYANGMESAQADGWRREGDSLVLTIGPRPAWRLLLMPAASLLAIATASACCLSVTFLVFNDASSQDETNAKFVCGLIAAASVWALFRVSQRFVWRARHVREHSTIRASRQILEITTPGLGGSGRYVVPSSRVLDLWGGSAGVAPGILTVLRLQVIERDGSVCDARIPWPRHASIGDVVARLRDELGLPPNPRDNAA